MEDDHDDHGHDDEHKEDGHDDHGHDDEHKEDGHDDHGHDDEHKEDGHDDHDHGDEHGDKVLQIVGVSNGTTYFKRELMHGDHADYTSANLVPVVVK